ncbi:hypothetical protein HRbin30_00812 [bacterium HR30]|nr:hypothetical protein HRbin30_00812 [bacterium HR30]
MTSVYVVSSLLPELLANVDRGARGTGRWSNERFFPSKGSDDPTEAGGSVALCSSARNEPSDLVKIVLPTAWRALRERARFLDVGLSRRA